MKLLNRTQERTLLRRRGEPAYSPWTAWEVCEGSEGLTHRECMQLIREWHADDAYNWCGEHCQVRTSFGREEYRIVPDSLKL